MVRFRSYFYASHIDSSYLFQIVFAVNEIKRIHRIYSLKLKFFIYCNLHHLCTYFVMSSFFVLFFYLFLFFLRFCFCIYFFFFHLFAGLWFNHSFCFSLNVHVDVYPQILILSIEPQINLHISCIFFVLFVEIIQIFFVGNLIWPHQRCMYIQRTLIIRFAQQ